MRHIRLLTIGLLLLTLFGCETKSCDPPTDLHVGDGGVITPESQGMSSQILNLGLSQADGAGFIDGLLVIRNGFIVAERYFNGYDSSGTHNVMSVSKSFLSAITGLAFHEGYLDSLDQRVLPYFPEYVNPGMDQRKQSITIRHLLTMRMGLDHEQTNYFTLYNSDNWIAATLAYPFVDAPGEEFHYNTFGTHLLSALITKATGVSTRAFGETHLLEPLGITVDNWQQDQQGYYFGGNSMHFTPREMAKFGLLYLNDGRRGSLQIVPSEWVSYTLSPSTDWDNSTWGPMTDIQYGGLWWLGRLNGQSAFMAIGHGGQFVISIPSLSMVVVSTADNNVDWETADAQEQAVLEIISTYVLGAVQD